MRRGLLGLLVLGLALMVMSSSNPASAASVRKSDNRLGSDTHPAETELPSSKPANLTPVSKDKQIPSPDQISVSTSASAASVRKSDNRLGSDTHQNTTAETELPSSKPSTLTPVSKDKQIPSPDQISVSTSDTHVRPEALEEVDNDDDDELNEHMELQSSKPPTQAPDGDGNAEGAGGNSGSENADAGIPIATTADVNAGASSPPPTTPVTTTIENDPDTATELTETTSLSPSEKPEDSTASSPKGGERTNNTAPPGATAVPVSEHEAATPEQKIPTTAAPAKYTAAPTTVKPSSEAPTQAEGNHIPAKEEQKSPEETQPPAEDKDTSSQQTPSDGGNPAEPEQGTTPEDSKIKSPEPVSPTKGAGTSLENSAKKKDESAEEARMTNPVATYAMLGGAIVLALICFLKGPASRRLSGFAPLQQDEGDELELGVSGAGTRQTGTGTPVDNLVLDACTSLGIPVFGAEKFQKMFADQSLTRVSQLKALDSEDWKRLELPAVIEESIQKHLSSSKSSAVEGSGRRSTGLNLRRRSSLSEHDELKPDLNSMTSPLFDASSPAAGFPASKSRGIGAAVVDDDDGNDDGFDDWNFEDDDGGWTD